MQTSKYVPLTYFNDARLSLAFGNGMSKVFAYFRKLYSDILEENYASEIVSYIEKKKSWNS